MKRTWIHSVLALALALTMIFAVAVQSFAEHDYRYDDSTVWDLIEVTVGNVEDDIGDGNFTAVPEDVLWGVDQTNIMFKQAINGPQADVKKPGKKIKKYLKSHASSTSVTVPFEVPFWTTPAPMKPAPVSSRTVPLIWVWAQMEDPPNPSRQAAMQSSLPRFLAFMSVISVDMVLSFSKFRRNWRGHLPFPKQN